MTLEEKRKKQEIKDRYRFGGYHWEDNDKGIWDTPWCAPISSDYTKPQNVLWGKKATFKQPLI